MANDTIKMMCNSQRILMDFSQSLLRADDISLNEKMAHLRASSCAVVKKKSLNNFMIFFFMFSRTQGLARKL